MQQFRPTDIGYVDSWLIKLATGKNSFDKEFFLTCL